MTLLHRASTVTGEAVLFIYIWTDWKTFNWSKVPGIVENCDWKFFNCWMKFVFAEILARTFLPSYRVCGRGRERDKGC